MNTNKYFIIKDNKPVLDWLNEYYPKKPSEYFLRSFNNKGVLIQSIANKMKLSNVEKNAIAYNPLLVNKLLLDLLKFNIERKRRYEDVIIFDSKYKNKLFYKEMDIFDFLDMCTNQIYWDDFIFKSSGKTLICLKKSVLYN
jgi:hypothetical protein